MGVSVKRIVVTGMGIVSPLGCGVQHVWQSLLAGKSGITRLSEQLVADIPCKVAGQVPSIDSDPLHGFDPLATIPARSAGSARSPMRYIPPMNAGRVVSRRSLSPLFWPTWPPGMCLSPTASGAPSARRSPPAQRVPRPSAMQRG